MEQIETRSEDFSPKSIKKVLLLYIVILGFIVLAGIFAQEYEPHSDIKTPATYPNPELKAL